MEALLNQLHDTRVQLRKELQGSNEARKRADAAERELGELRAQLEQRASAGSGNEPQNQDSLEVRHYFRWHHVVLAVVHSFWDGFSCP